MPRHDPDGSKVIRQRALEGHTIENPQRLLTASKMIAECVAKMKRPSFDELPLQRDHPKASAWGLWGREDELGSLNLLTSKIVAQAGKEIQTGEVIPLSLPLETPVLPMNPRRAACVHNLIAKGYANDDETQLNTQSSSHWDGLRHYPYQIDAESRYYNRVTNKDIAETSKIGIQNMARRGIAGRGVLLDWREHVKQHNLVYSPFSSRGISLQELVEVAEAQKVTFEPGDILLIRTGWTEEYHKLTYDEKIQLAKREERTFVGVEASEEMIRWHWDNQFAAVASDTNAYEMWPPTKPWGVSCHEVFLSGWGMPIGELWDLERLSMTCKAAKRWTFMLTSSALNLSGGVASPANALAIL